MCKIASLPVAALAVVSLTSTACSSGSDSGSPTPSSAPSSPARPSDTASATPSTTGSPARPTKPRTAGELTKALLGLDDMPSGFSQPDRGDEVGGRLSSKNAKCARLVALTKANKITGSRATVYRSFSGGPQGPLIEESIDALPSAEAVQVFQASMKSAAASCRTLTLRITGQGSSPMAVREISAPQAGEHPLAIHLTATAGPMEGLEVSLVSTGLNNVVVSMSFLGAAGNDVKGATEAAVDKARTVLGA